MPSQAVPVNASPGRTDAEHAFMTLRETLNDEKWLCRSGFHTRHAFAGIRFPTYEQRTKGLFRAAGYDV